jgi:coproporphyrinogen III oxidase-like Fe-S oxidoreductase
MEIETLRATLAACRRRCHYCDFSIVATGDSNRDHWHAQMETYVDAVCREILATAVCAPLLSR